MAEINWTSEHLDEFVQEVKSNMAAVGGELGGHTADKNNPHGVTKEQIGLGNVDNSSDLDKPVSTATQAALDNKVDKVEGKGLSTNDYTDADKTKLANIADGATKTEASTTNGNIRINGAETAVYTHPTGAGNEHIPSDGTAGQVLKRAPDGTAVWDNVVAIIGNEKVACAGIADSALYADEAAHAATADLASQAHQADRAAEADYATHSGTASRATSADFTPNAEEASHAANADFATHAACDPLGNAITDTYQTKAEANEAINRILGTSSTLVWEHVRGDAEMAGNKALQLDTVYGMMVYEAVTKKVTFNKIEVPIYVSEGCSAMYGICTAAYSPDPASDLWWRLLQPQNFPPVATGTLSPYEVSHASPQRTVIRLPSPVTVEANNYIAVMVIARDGGRACMNIWDETLITPAQNPPRHKIAVNIASADFTSSWIEQDFQSQRQCTFKLSLEQQNTRLEWSSINGPLPEEKVAENSLSPSVLKDFYDIRVGGKNLFDKNRAVKDAILSPSGEFALGNEGWYTSEFIKLEPGSTITISHCRYAAEYDKDYAFIAGTHGSFDPQSSHTRTVTSATRYVRFTVSKNSLDCAQLEMGSTATAYEGCRYAVYFKDVKLFDIGGDFNMGKKYVTLGDYTQFVDREKYQIYHPSGSGTSKVKAVLRNIAARLNSGGNTIEISTKGINGPYEYSVEFNSLNFPYLMEDSSIEHILLLPWTRTTCEPESEGEITKQTADSWRMVVITDRGQIFHNFPSRAAGYDGAEAEGDIIRFEESVVWDLPARKFPSKSPDASGAEFFFPCLPDECYVHHPMLSSDPDFYDRYGNGGFGISITKNGVTYPRFYRPRMDKAHNSFRFMGGYEPGDKITLIGTYTSNCYEGEGTRTCVFATDDGGRSWYNKFEFSDTGTAPNWCNGIDLSDTSVFYYDYPAEEFKVVKVTPVVPNDAVKEPDKLFQITDNNVVVSFISRYNPGLVYTSTPHGLKTGDIIAFKLGPNAEGAHDPWSCLCNGDISETSPGSGVLFKVLVLDETSFSLYEYVHAPGGIPARHIHGITRCKDGWTINTGEAYPEGWVLYMQMLEADTYAVKRAWQDFAVLRLTSGEKSVQRAIGSIVLDDADNTVIFCSDNENTPREPIALPEGRAAAAISRSSTGIYKGRLADIDDMGKFEIIFDAQQTGCFFKRKCGALVYLGQRGEFAISFDLGKTWHTEDLYLRSTFLEHFCGETNDKIIVIDDIILAIK